jgi:hypothetical protein
MLITAHDVLRLLIKYVFVFRYPAVRISVLAPFYLTFVYVFFSEFLFVYRK